MALYYISLEIHNNVIFSKKIEEFTRLIYYLPYPEITLVIIKCQV